MRVFLKSQQQKPLGHEATIALTFLTVPAHGCSTGFIWFWSRIPISRLSHAFTVKTLATRVPGSYLCPVETRVPPVGPLETATWVRCTLLRHASNLSRACTQLSRACSVRDAAGLNGLAETSIVPTGCVRWPLATEARAPWCRRPEKPAIERPSAKGHFLPNGLGVIYTYS